mmetsp:Transcript_671/g.1600  ORF Transcript_671/g.1600 Transcript_671/m.1600 type:complete len:330 (-) Transcript_671:184-1173(-)
MERSALCQRLGLDGGAQAPLIASLVEGFLLRDSGAKTDAKHAPGGLRGPRPDPLMVGPEGKTPDRQAVEPADAAPSPFDVTTPSSAFLGQDDILSVKRAPPSAAPRRSPLAAVPQSQPRFSPAAQPGGPEESGGRSSEDVLEGSLSSEGSPGATSERTARSGRDDPGRSLELQSSSDSLPPPLQRRPELAPLPQPRGRVPLSPLKAPGSLGLPSKTARSSLDVKQELLRDGLLPMSGKPQKEEGNGGTSSGGDIEAEYSGVTEEVLEEDLEEDTVSEIGDLSDNHHSASRGGMSLDLHSRHIQASDRSGELDADADVDYFENAVEDLLK